MRNFIFDIMLTALFALALTISKMEKEIEKENERQHIEMLQTIWVKSAKEIQPQNNLFNLGLEDGNK